MRVDLPEGCSMKDAPDHEVTVAFALRELHDTVTVFTIDHTEAAMNEDLAMILSWAVQGRERFPELSMAQAIMAAITWWRG